MLDTLIIIVYLFIISYVGLRAGRGIKTMKDYAVYQKPFSTTMLVAIMCGSMIGGGVTISTVDKIHSLGVIFILTGIGGIIDTFLTAQVIAPRMVRFYGMISAGDIMDSFYGKVGRVITGISGTIVSMGIVGAQIGAMGLLFHYFFNISQSVAMLCGATIVVVYAGIGGIRTATGTDLIQFGILVVAVPVVCNIVLMQVGGYEGLIHTLPASHLTFFPNKELTLKYFSIFLVFCVPYIGPDKIQRILMVKDAKQIKSTLTITALIHIPFFLLILCIGLSSYIINPDIESKFALPYLLGMILPIGIKGLAIAGMLAVIMSVAEARLNAASIMLVHDVIKPLMKNSISDHAELNTARVATFLLGGGATLCAFSYKTAIEIALGFMNFWSSTVLIPLIVGILGIKAKVNTFLISAGVGLMASMIWRIFTLEKHYGVDSILIGMVANGIAFLFTHMAQRREEEAKITKNTPLSLKYRSLPSSTFSLLNRIGSVNKHVIHIITFSRDRVEMFGAQYKLFGIFAVLNYIVPYFMWSYVPMEHQKTVIAIRIISAILCFFLIAKDDWPDYLRPYLPFYWHVTLFFCLPFSTTYMLFICHSSTLWMMNMALSLFLLAVLVDWLSFTIILGLGVTGGYAFYHIVGGDFAWAHLSGETRFVSIYIYFFAIAIGGLFSRNKEFVQKQTNKLLVEKVRERTEALESALKARSEFLDNVSHEMRVPVHGIQNYSELLVDEGDSMEKEDMIRVAKKILISSDRLWSLMSNLLDLSKYKAGKMMIDKQETDLSEAIEEIIEECKPLYMDKKDLTISYDVLTNSKTIVCDKIRIQQVVRNLLANAIQFTERGRIQATLTKVMTPLEEKGEEGYGLQFSLGDEGKGIPEEELSAIFSPFIQSTRTKTGAGGTGLGLSISREIVFLHKGKIWAENNIDGKGATLYFVLPLEKETPRFKELASER